MTDILKGKIIVESIKSYKNRQEWTDIYVENNYPEAIEYMFKNFDRIFCDSSSNSNSSSSSSSSSEVSSMVPQGARIKKLDQGDRSVEYEYDNNYTSTSTNANRLNAIIKSDFVLSALLGLPLIRCM